MLKDGVKESEGRDYKTNGEISILYMKQVMEDINFHSLRKSLLVRWSGPGTFGRKQLIVLVGLSYFCYSSPSIISGISFGNAHFPANLPDFEIYWHRVEHGERTGYACRL